VIVIGVLLKWKRITTEATYDQVRIYRSDSSNGTYTFIHTQSIEDSSYYDPDGLRTNWYQLEWYDSISGYVSARSTSIQSGEYYGYATVDEVRQFTNISTTDIDDTQLATLIEFASAQVNGDINIYREEEIISYINDHKQNKIDGVNSTYWMDMYPIGDANNDFHVTTADIEVFQYDANTDPTTKTKLTVTYVNPATGEFRISTAPASDMKLTVTYYTCNRRVDLPDRLVKLATIYLTASFGYGKLNIGKAPRFHMGNLTVFRDTHSSQTYYMKYIGILAVVNDRNAMNTIEGTSMPADRVFDASLQRPGGN